MRLGKSSPSNLIFFLPIQKCNRLAAQIILLISKIVEERGEQLSLGLATGNSWEPVYQEIAEICRNEEIVFPKNAFLSQLDNFLGSCITDAYDYKNQLVQNVIYPLGLGINQLHLPPNIDNALLPEELVKFDNLLLEHTPHVQCLGLGPDGHFAHVFPFDSKQLSDEEFLSKMTSRVLLPDDYRVKTSQEYHVDLSKFPKASTSQYPGTISKARLKVCLVNDSFSKTEALIQAHSGKPNGEFPANFLDGFEDVIWIVSDIHYNAFIEEYPSRLSLIEPKADRILRYYKFLN